VTRCAQDRGGAAIADGDGCHVEMDCGGVAHGEVDTCEQSVGSGARVNESERIKLVSIVRTDPFTGELQML
jgi:hypothetical protein